MLRLRQSRIRPDVVVDHHPTCDLASSFIDLTTDLCARHPDWQVIVVDNASAGDLRTLLPPAANLIVLPHAMRRGAGAARNTGLTRIGGTFVVFMDDDDAMDWDAVAATMALMQARPAVEMAVSSYRFLREGLILPPHAQDMQILTRVLQGRDSRVVSIAGHEDLLRLTNFPWTKVYRSAFVRRSACGSRRPWCRTTSRRTGSRCCTPAPCS